MSRAIAYVTEAFGERTEGDEENKNEDDPGRGHRWEGERVYAEIKSQPGIDFVANLYKVMAPKPEYLAANWNKVKAVMGR